MQLFYTKDLGRGFEADVGAVCAIDRDYGESNLIAGPSERIPADAS